MTRLADVVSRFWPAVVLAWGAAAVLAVVAVPPFEQVAAFDEAMFLPPGSPAVEGQRLTEEGWPDDDFTRSATLALVRPDRPLDEQDARYAHDLMAWLEAPGAPETFHAVTSHLRDPDLADVLTSADGHVWLVTVGVETHPYAPETRAAVRALRAHLVADPAPEGLDTYVTGTAGIAVDEDEAIQASVSRTQLLSVGLVVALLYWVFRAPLAPLVPLLTVGTAYLVSVGVVTGLAGAGMQVSYLFETFSIVIVFGAGTDYCLLIMSRYGEELRLGRRAGIEDDGPLRRATLVATMAVLGGVMASSAASTVVGFSAQSFAQFGLFRTMGPALAVTVAITFAAGLTLTPALVRGFGRSLFWPSATGRGPTGEGAPLVTQAGPEAARPRTGTEVP